MVVVRYHPLVEDIEKKTHRTVSIKTRPTSENLALCSPQRYSPLYRIPAELRSLIFEFVCRPYEDNECRYEEGLRTAQFCRPGHRARHLTSTSLLLTCHLVWLEASHLPMKLGDHSFFFREELQPTYLQRIHWNEDGRLESTLLDEQGVIC